MLSHGSVSPKCHQQSRLLNKLIIITFCNYIRVSTTRKQNCPLDLLAKPTNKNQRNVAKSEINVTVKFTQPLSCVCQVHDGLTAIYECMFWLKVRP